MAFIMKRMPREGITMNTNYITSKSNQSHETRVFEQKFCAREQDVDSGRNVCGDNGHPASSKTGIALYERRRVPAIRRGIQTEDRCPDLAGSHPPLDSLLFGRIELSVVFLNKCDSFGFSPNESHVQNV